MKYPAPRQESRILHCVHAAQVILVLASFIIAIARLAFYGGPRSRMDVWIIAVSVKSLVVLAYEISTERFLKLRRFASMKAYMILNMVEFVFWFAAAIISIMGMSSCSGTGCTYTGILIALAFILIFLALITTIITTRQFYYRKKHGHHPDEQHWTRVLGRSYSDNSFDMPGNKV